MATSTTTKRLTQNRWMTVNMASIVVQAGLALRRGNMKRVALLVVTALIGSRLPKVSYAIQGALTANDIRKKFRSGR